MIEAEQIEVDQCRRYGPWDHRLRPAANVAADPVSAAPGRSRSGSLDARAFGPSASPTPKGVAQDDGPGRQARKRTATVKSHAGRFVFGRGRKMIFVEHGVARLAQWRESATNAAALVCSSALPVPDSASISASIAGGSSLLGGVDDRIAARATRPAGSWSGERPVDQETMPKASQARAFSAERTSPRT